MKWFKPILFGALVIYLFIGNIGLTIFKHYCEEDGLFTAYIFNSNDHCENETTDSILPDCCKKNKIESKQSQFKDNCCSDEFKCFKISLDFYKGKEDLSHYGILVYNEIIPINSPSFTQIHSECINKYIDPPPKFHGRILLIKNQVFRI